MSIDKLKNEKMQRIVPTILEAKINTNANNFSFKLQKESPAHLFLTNLSKTM